MQTFLPYPSFQQTATCLDYRRLGKQRSECKQILNALRHGGGWSNHPAVKMWRGHERTLCLYAIVICLEWRQRGYKDQQLEWFINRVLDTPNGEDPPWLGDDAFHASHRSNLLRKKPDHYEQFSWDESPDLPYVWP